MTPDSEVLHEIANTTNLDREADIVFVHGLGGASHATWRHGQEGKDGHFFWPEELGKDVPHCGIWSVGYPAGFTSLGKPGMIIEKRAGNLSQKLSNAGLGVRPLLFITHSMGGLVVKSLIVGSQTLADADRKRLVNMIRGIVFCATPHRGSAFADAAGVLGLFLGGSQDHVKEMRANAEPLDILHDQFIEWHRHHTAPIESYAENIGLFRTRRWWRPLPLGLVVPRASANPGIAGHTVRDVDDDHLTLVKPKDRRNDVYAGVLRFVRATLTVVSPERTNLTPADRPPVVSATQSVVKTITALAPSKTRSGPPGLQPSSAPLAFHADISRIDNYAPEKLIGREAETKLLSDGWEQAVRGETKRPHVLTFVALGGEGKTSLVAKWAADLAHQGWPGCEAVFAWSFYHQGTDEKTADSSDLFLKEALTVFGDAVMADSAQSAFDKGRRLAQLVGERRALLILDGLEPLQYAPTLPTPGELKDSGLAALLKGLAANNHGLCVVTTRYSIPDLRAFFGKTVQEEKLTRLSTEAGVALLQSFKVKGSLRKVIPSADGRELLNEFEKLVEDVQGHALTLNLLGSYLHDAHGGDIRKRDLVKLGDAAEEQGGHAFRVMDAYVTSFEGEGEKGQRALAVLQLLGLFDRPAAADCLAALLKAPAVPDLTEALIEMSEAQQSLVFTKLEKAKLLSVNRDAAGTLLSLDPHPLLREYFALQLHTQHPEAWRAGHRRVFEHLCDTTKEGDQPTLEDLQPLYQAVAHGCQAGMQQEACDKVYYARIARRQEGYAAHKLGAFGSDLGAVACFFEQPWSRVSPALTEADQAWLLNEAAFRLRALGRLTEALEPMREGLEMGVKQENWGEAARRASNLSELELTLGEVAKAVRDAEQSVTYAHRSGDAFQPFFNRVTVADALNQAGRRAEAEANFREAEGMQAERQPDYKLLYGIAGFRYCDLLLATPERAAWQCISGSAGLQPAVSGVLPETLQRAVTDKSLFSHGEARSSAAPAARRSGQDIHAARIQSCRAVSERAAKTLQWAEENNASLLNVALVHLTLGRAALYEAILQSSSLAPCYSSLQHAVDGLRRAGQQDYLPRGLFTRAWLRSLTGARTGPESAQSDLDEAWEIAERGPMPLFLADIHLHRARLFGPHAPSAIGDPYPWESPAADLAAARALIMKHGYLRRLEELEDAEAAAKTW